MDLKKIQSQTLTLGIWSAVFMILLPPAGILTGLMGIIKAKKYFRNGGPNEGRVITGKVMSIVCMIANILVTVIFGTVMALMYFLD